jgi:hypothetical protein
VEWLAGLRSLDPEDSGELTLERNPDGRTASGSSYGDLASHLELVDAREHRALTVLDALDAPRQAESDVALPDRTLTMTLSSLEDLPRLFEQIGNLANRLPVRTRRVRVTFEDPDR